MPATPAERLLACRLVAMPENANHSGDIFGGWLLSQADLAGSILAIRHAAGRVVTVAVESFRFLAPVRVGDLVSCYAQLERIGTSSIRVRIEVDIDRMRAGHETARVAEGLFVYVALDDAGRPRALVG
jgi:acyl-CoA thioesterase YciA